MFKKTVSGIMTLIAAMALVAFIACKNQPEEPDNTEIPPIGPGDPGAFSSPAKDDTKLYHTNPIISSIYSADPSAHVWPTFPDRLFLYPSQDIDPPQGCSLMDRYHVFSTDNMYNWVDHGEILKRNDLPTTDPWGPHHNNAYFMWAPDAAYNPNAVGPEGRRGPYFFYFPHSTGDGSTWGANWKIGVIWSDSPYGGFNSSEAIPMRYKDGTEIKGGGDLIDPCIFQDGNDYYLVTGGSQTNRVAKIGPDMVTLAEDFTVQAFDNRFPEYRTSHDVVITDNPLPRYHEGPWMFTRVNSYGQKVYYLMYAAGKPAGAPASRGGYLAYAISTDGPYGPWDFKGDILPGVTNDTNHGSIVEFKGQWYLFYHTDKKSNGVGELRSVSAEQVFFEDDGIIKKVKNTDYGAPINGSETTADSLDTAFGAGNWKFELSLEDWKEFKAEEQRQNYPDNTDGYILHKDYVVKNLNRATPETFVDGTTNLILNKITYLAASDALINFHFTDAYAEFRNIDGGEGGVALLEAYYSSPNTKTMTLHINGVENPLPFQFKLIANSNFGYTRIKISLQDGMNTIKFSGLKDATFNLRQISIYFPEPE